MPVHWQELSAGWVSVSENLRWQAVFAYMGLAEDLPVPPRHGVKRDGGSVEPAVTPKRQKNNKYMSAKSSTPKRRPQKPQPPDQDPDQGLETPVKVEPKFKRLRRANAADVEGKNLEGDENEMQQQDVPDRVDQARPANFGQPRTLDTMLSAAKRPLKRRRRKATAKNRNTDPDAERQEDDGSLDMDFEDRFLDDTQLYLKK